MSDVTERTKEPMKKKKVIIRENAPVAMMQHDIMVDLEAEEVKIEEKIQVNRRRLRQKKSQNYAEWEEVEEVEEVEEEEEEEDWRADIGGEELNVLMYIQCKQEIVSVIIVVKWLLIKSFKII